jgi:RNA polymerase sigma-70 factor (ECF subfamily)
VLGVLYLMFNEGFWLRAELSAEAIRLARVLVELMPDEPEACGLLALMLLHEARRPARLAGDGSLVTLGEQDRSRWDRAAIDEGVRLLDGSAGAYQLQAAVAAAHATAPRAADTDWARIAALYGELGRRNPSPVVELNRAVAVAMACGPAAGLELVDRLADSGALGGYHLLPATRADLLRRLGRTGDAAAAYREAYDLAPTDVERRFIARRLEEM